jgi:hypothetical protein
MGITMTLAHNLIAGRDQRIADFAYRMSKKMAALKPRQATGCAPLFCYDESAQRRRRQP